MSYLSVFTPILAEWHIISSYIDFVGVNGGVVHVVCSNICLFGVINGVVHGHGFEFFVMFVWVRIFDIWGSVVV
jgi:hypothetical protein